MNKHIAACMHALGWKQKKTTETQPVRQTTSIAKGEKGPKRVSAFRRKLKETQAGAFLISNRTCPAKLGDV